MYTTSRFLLLVLAGLPLGAALAPVAPTISSVDPVDIWVGVGQFTMTVNGSNFRSNGEVRWDGVGLQTTFVNDTRLTAIVPASFIATAGSHQLTVFVPGGQGGTSNVRTFNVLNPPPSLASISPTSAPVFTALVAVTVNGSNFVPSSVVHFRGSAKQTTFVSSTRLTATLSIADLAVVGTGQITVTTPGPGGGSSVGASFTVIHPTPTVTLLAPSQRQVGTSAFTLTVDGSNYFSGTNSVVLWNGSVRPTTFVSSTRLTASIPATDLATTGTANVTVRTSAGKSSQTSQPAVFSITNLATINPPLTTVQPPPNLAAQVLGPFGGTGGTRFTRDCGAGQVMSGLSYRAGLVVDALVLLCRPVRSDGTLGTERAVGDAVGGGGPFTIAHCGGTTVVGAVTVQAGIYVDGVVMFCKEWDPATRRFIADSPNLIVVQFGRPVFTGSQTFKCNETITTQPARGIHGRAQNVVDALGIICDEP